MGVLALLVAGGLEWGARRQRARFDTVLATESATCGEVQGLFSAVEAEVGAGSLARMIEVRAKAVGDGRAPLSGKAAAWYRSIVTEAYLEWSDTNSPSAATKVVGGQEHAPVRPDRQLVERKRVLEEHRAEGFLEVEDGSGRLSIDLDGADVEDALQVLDRLDRDEDHRPGKPGRVGLHHAEWIVPPGTPLTVVGEARRRDGTVVVGEPEGAAPLLVSTRSADDLASRAGKQANGMRVGAAAVGVSGVVLVALGLAL